MSTAPSRAPVVIQPGEGPAYWVLSDHITFKLGPEHTGGAFALAETFVPPGGGPPPHVHSREDELFCVLEGNFAFRSGDQTVVGTPGFCAYLRKGGLHTFKNIGDTPGRLFLGAAPCGFERFVTEIGKPSTGTSSMPEIRQEDIARLMALAPKYGITMRPDAGPATEGPPRPADRRYWVAGDLVTMKLVCGDTGGRFCMAEVKTWRGGGTPAHSHRRQDEVFYVLEGEYEFLAGDRTVRQGPGSLVYIPQGVRHSFTNVGPAPGRMIMIQSPGGFEAFFEEAGTVAEGESATPPPGRVDAAKMAALLEKHGMDVPSRGG